MTTVSNIAYLVHSQYLISILYAVVTVSFDGQETVQFVNESLLLTEVCLNVSHTNLERDITVTIDTVQGTAQGNVLVI